MAKFNHAYDIGFEVVSEKEDGSDVTSAMFSAALRKRADDLDASFNPMDPSDKGGEWLEACGAPFDTYEIEFSLLEHIQTLEIELEAVHTDSGTAYDFKTWLHRTAADRDRPYFTKAGELLELYARRDGGGN